MSKHVAGRELEANRGETAPARPSLFRVSFTSRKRRVSLHDRASHSGQDNVRRRITCMGTESLNCRRARKQEQMSSPIIFREEVSESEYTPDQLSVACVDIRIACGHVKNYARSVKLSLDEKVEYQRAIMAFERIANAMLKLSHETR